MFYNNHCRLSGCSSGGLECLLGVQEVAGSSPVTPTEQKGFRDSDTRFALKISLFYLC